MEPKEVVREFIDYKVELLKKTLWSAKDPELLSPIEEEWIDTEQLCKIFKISSTTAQRMRKEGEIPYTYFGAKCIYPRSYVSISLMIKAITNLK